MIKKYIIITGLVLFAGSISAQTTINGGNVSGTWTQANSPYLIFEEITIPNDSTLSIEPGIVVEFQGNYSLQVQGRLLAVGVENDTILFTINDTIGFSDPDNSLGGWRGIRFIDTPLTNDSSKIVYCKLQYGKAVADVWHLNAGGAICATQFGKVLVSNCLLTHNIAGGRESDAPSGGAVHMAWSDITFIETIFRYNYAHDGGAIYSYNSDPTFIDCLIANNSAIQAGGLGADASSNVTLINSSVLDNHSQGWGGGLLFGNNSINSLENVTISGNTAYWGAGIGALSCEVQISNCTIGENISSGLGGGIAADFCELEIENTTFNQNTANTAGGLHSYHTDLQIDSCVFQGNRTTEGVAGAINYIVDSTNFGGLYQVEITNSRFIENESMSICAGVYIEQLNSDNSLINALIDQCEFIQNHADRVCPLRFAGNIDGFTVSNSIFNGNTSTRWTAGPGFLSGCSGQALNCVFSSNYSYVTDSSATATGSGVGSGAHVDYINCTATDTSEFDGIGLSIRGGATATVLNSIIWGYNNPISITTAQNLGSTFYVNYCNIENGIDSVRVSDSLSTLYWGMGNIAEEPQFVDVQNGDFHLQNTSANIGSGIDCITLNDLMYCAPESDIEGNPRPAPEGSSTDIGAYENNLGNPSSIRENIPQLPVRFRLSQNYPNPFNPRTIITYELPTTITVELSVFNLLGQKVVTLVSGEHKAGNHQVEWDASGFASGIYYYQINAGEFQDVKKMILIR